MARLRLCPTSPLAFLLQGHIGRTRYWRSPHDKAILATAIVRGCGIATRNIRDFKAAGVPLVNPLDPDTWFDEPVARFVPGAS